MGLFCIWRVYNIKHIHFQHLFINPVEYRLPKYKAEVSDSCVFPL